MTIRTIGNAALSVAVDTIGAELASLRTPDGAEWLWQGDPAIWASRAPILFPVVGRSPDGAISVGGRRYPMTPHGFVRKAAFAVAEETPTELRLRLTDSDETRAAYPFAFTLDLVFALDGGTLVNRAEITNAGIERMPVSFGFHPGFVWPLPGAGKATHVVTLAESEAPPTYRLGEGQLLSLTPEPSLFAAGRFTPSAADFVRDAVILKGLASRAVTFGVVGGPEVEVTFGDLTSLGIWQKPGAPYLCIEPWQGLAAAIGAGDALADRPGIVWLEPGEVRNFTMTITPRAKAA